MASGCATSTEVANCEGRAEGAACVGVVRDEGVCIGGACRSVICGDGETSGTEVCDDGNTVAGDGCSPHCDSTEICGNGTADFAVGEQCDDGNLNDDDTCRTDCSIPHCGDGRVDRQNGEACDVGGGNSNQPDASCRPNCQPRRCGDGVADTNEACDDGNLQSGDGCSGDCRSKEACGNGYIDLAKGEQCDDRNPRGLSEDGCSSNCAAEVRTWQPWLRGELARTGHALAYHAALARVVLFGGGTANGSLFGDTWVFDGYHWRQQRLEVAPTARYGHTMAYDAARERIVLFGGRGAQGELDETWVYDRLGWTRLTPTTKPPARSSHAMAYDRVRQQLVIFGGESGSLLRDDTWVFDGTDWVARGIESPPARRSHAMVADENSGNIVMFGGFHHTGAWGDTWLFDGAHWTAVATPNAPAARGEHAMYYDVALARVMLVGGAVVSGFFSSVTYASDVWFFDGASWTQTFGPGGLPAGRAGHAVTYDVVRANAVMFGGHHAEGPLADAWTYADARWRLVAEQPQGGPGYGMVYDSQRGAVLFVSNGTWLFDGAWSKLDTLNHPNLAPGFAIAFNSTLQQVVLFGHDAQVPDIKQTWILEGRQWRLLNGQNPQFAEFPELAYDEGRQQLVLFDGRRTWHLVSSDWIEVGTAAAPSPRSGYGFAYDAKHGTIVLFGGRSAAGVLLDDTWVFDGNNWVALPTDVRPTARYGHALTYQRASGEILLFGGYGEAGPQHDTWLYHDGAWQLLLTAIRPVVRTQHALAHDPVRNRVVLFGGQSATASSLHDTWELTFASASARPDRCLDATLDSDLDGFAGCDDPDCAYRCTPLCSALATCDQATAPRCGDGVCDSYHLREDALLCPSDCAL